jgi:hypothetical protein
MKITIEINISRVDMLELLPNGNVCEIGVAKGDFAELIIKHNNPKKLFLVDVWDNIEMSYSDSNMVDKNSQNKRYDYVLNKFNDYSSVNLIRKSSLEAHKEFNKNFFDWIYIDADHSYNGCLNDLNNFDEKVKTDGYICGHDFNNIIKNGYGVNQAVNDFIKEKNYFLSFITLDKKKYMYVNNDKKDFKEGSFIISKNQNSHQNLLNKIIKSKLI